MNSNSLIAPMVMREAMRTKKTVGKIGMEIEIEADSVIPLIGIPGWTSVPDGSLRGQSIELVLTSPVDRSVLPGYLREVEDRIKECNVKVKDTGRAGVHVHLNMQERTPAQVFNFICAFMIFEDSLIDFCGDIRVGNLFCLRTRDAEALIDSLVAAINARDFRSLRNDEVRYAALNTTALSRYGSLEFRSMRSTTDPALLLEWVDLLLLVEAWAMSFSDPISLMQAFSQRGTAAIHDDVFGERMTIPYDPQSMYEGVRQAQIIAYATSDWDIDYWKATKELVSHGLRGFAEEDRMLTLIENRTRYYANLDEVNMLTKHYKRYMERRMEEVPNAKKQTGAW